LVTTADKAAGVCATGSPSVPLLDHAWVSLSSAPVLYPVACAGGTIRPIPLPDNRTQRTVVISYDIGGSIEATTVPRLNKCAVVTDIWWRADGR
jgi:hypothetical protein